MQFGDSTITTPYDNPVQYDPDWRNSFALALLDYPNERLPQEYEHYKRDPWIRKQITYIKAARSGRRLSNDDNNLRLASLWFQGSRPSDVKSRIEPLLLTPISFDVISLDIGGGNVPVEAFKAYEKLYFNIRLDNGGQNESCQLRQYFALPSGVKLSKASDTELWRMVGALMGYDTLVSMWLWSGAHGLTNQSRDYMMDEMWRVAQSNLFLDIFAGRVNTESLSKLLGAFTNQTRMVRETNSTTSVGLETSKTLLAFLQMTAPEIINSAKTVDASKDVVTKQIRDRLAAQKNVSMQDVVDRGVDIGEDALNQKMREQFSNFATDTESTKKADGRR